ncbi:MAG: hypothetical protein IBX55_12840 [Methyloprofundus sp.]|nr:hypothetical protein [Methyloprofundus sp.]
MTSFTLSELLNPVDSSDKLQLSDAKRSIHYFDACELLVDDFKKIKSVFIRVHEDHNVTLIFDKAYNFELTISGGYLGRPIETSQPYIWIPKLAIERQINPNKQILFEQPTPFSGFSWEGNKASFSLQAPTQRKLDLIIWSFPSDFPIEELLSSTSIETQGYFLWGSHGCINNPADLYRHLIHGAIYDLRYSWPNNKKCFSENEAHALYTVFSGLEKATEKSIYRCLQLQIVLSVVQRQADDGGWYHGMWTDSSECHYRLHTSALHLLMDEYQREPCLEIENALKKGVEFSSKTTDTLDCGAWFLHDSLELSEEAMNKGPFNWITNKTLGKSVSNMLVLNTHLDTSIAINRYQKITGDTQYAGLIESALQSTRTVLDFKPAEWLYKRLFWAIGLTMLPTDKASQLPAHVRAIKRIAWQFLIKKLPDIKARFPRLVMPNGYIDRELSLRTWAIDYQTINLMDLARHAYAFPGAFDEKILDKALEFTQTSGLIKRYRELTPGKRYSIGFWAEALYYRCLTKPDLKYRAWLAEAMQECHDLNFGLPPSLLGTNGEALTNLKSITSPLINNPEVLIANLSYDQHIEFLLLNTSNLGVTIDWLQVPLSHMDWRHIGTQLIQEKVLTIPAKSWIIGSTVSH